MKGEIDLKRFTDKYEYFIIATLLLIALCYHLYATWGGLIWNSDSFHYWAASRGFQSDFVFKAHDGGSYTFWPPLFPIILSLFNEESYHIFQASSLLSSLFFVYLLLKLISNKNLAILSLALFLLSIYPYLISSFLWSETIFILLFYSGLFFYLKWTIEQSKHHFLIIATILLSLMCLQRNAGVFIILGLFTYSLITFLKAKNWLYFIKMNLTHLIMITPNMIWNISQKIQYPEEFYFYNSPLFIDFFSNFKTLSIELLRIFIPFGDQISLSLLIIAGIIILSITFFSKINTILSTVYLTYIFSFMLMPKFELSEIGRFLTPIIPILILQLVYLCKRVYGKPNSNKMKVVFSAVIALLLIYNIVRTAKNISQWNYRSIHYQKSAQIY
jgi:hypothetical protein